MHPDRNFNNPTVSPDELREKFDLINLAYEILSVPSNRRSYDQLSSSPSLFSSAFSPTTPPPSSHAVYNNSYYGYPPPTFDRFPLISNYIIAFGIILFIVMGSTLQYYRFDNYKRQVKSQIDNQNAKIVQNYREVRKQASGRTKQEHFDLLRNHAEKLREFGKKEK